MQIKEINVLKNELLPLHFLLHGRFRHIMCNISAVGCIWLQLMQNYESWAGETDNSSPLAFHQKNTLCEKGILSCFLTWLNELQHNLLIPTGWAFAPTSSHCHARLGASSAERRSAWGSWDCEIMWSSGRMWKEVHLPVWCGLTGHEWFLDLSVMVLSFYSNLMATVSFCLFLSSKTASRILFFG